MDLSDCFCELLLLGVRERADVFDIVDRHFEKCEVCSVLCKQENLETEMAFALRCLKRFQMLQGQKEDNIDTRVLKSIL